MRSRWGLWKQLRGKETGLGWDHDKGTISATDEWWDLKVKENSKFEAFREE
nr:L10-interacting MYB domain-containing protein-like [Ipomoea batatas]